MALGYYWALWLSCGWASDLWPLLQSVIIQDPCATTLTGVHLGSTSRSPVCRGHVHSALFQLQKSLKLEEYEVI